MQQDMMASVCECARECSNMLKEQIAVLKDNLAKGQLQNERALKQIAEANAKYKERALKQIAEANAKYKDPAKPPCCYRCFYADEECR